MKMNHDLIRKYIRIVGIVFFIFVGITKFKKMIESGGKDDDDSGLPPMPPEGGEVVPSNAAEPADPDDDL